MPIASRTPPAAPSAAVPAARTWVVGSPALSMACLMAVSAAFPTLWPEAVRNHLGAGVALELVAIHSFLFFLLPIVMRPKTWWGRLLRWSAVALLVAFYVGLALQTSDGVSLLADLLVLLTVTYGGPLLRQPDENRIATALVRWAYCFLSFGLAMAMTMPVFGETDRGLYALGTLYFGALGFLDSVNGFERFVVWRRRKQRAERRRR